MTTKISGRPTSRTNLTQMMRAAAALVTIGTVVAVTSQAAHAGVFVNHCEPVLRSRPQYGSPQTTRR